ncbi:hypothetical protein SDC9_153428 [bioreactor metagenome]|uniref:Secretion system C-terminal sorting domain-containing protein n=1 Tax=bioreactor metagenome TaxID=1076179 RepID=A0A645EY47_9ZZZZ
MDKPTPNPAKDNLAVTFSLSSETNVRLSIFDMTGKEIYVLSEAIYSGKVHNLSFNIDNIPSGTYNIVINANGNVVSQPFTVVK